MTKHEEAIEAMAEAIYTHANDEVSWNAVVQLAGNGDTYMIGLSEFTRAEANEALSALLTLYHGIKGLIDGTHTAVPREPKAAQVDAGARYARGEGLSQDCYAISRGVYRAMLAAADGVAEAAIRAGKGE